ncbi:MAG: hypothetical protein WDZ41_03260 [Candidatus Babeliales bacterium]
MKIKYSFVLLTFFSINAMEIVQSSNSFVNFPVFAPTRLGEVKLLHDGKDFFVYKEDMIKRIQPGRIDKVLRRACPESLLALEDKLCLSLNESEEGEYSLDGYIKVNGGGIPFACLFAAVPQLVGKVLPAIAASKMIGKLISKFSSEKKHGASSSLGMLRDAISSAGVTNEFLSKARTQAELIRENFSSAMDFIPGGPAAKEVVSSTASNVSKRLVPYIPFITINGQPIAEGTRTALTAAHLTQTAALNAVGSAVVDQVGAQNIVAFTANTATATNNISWAAYSKFIDKLSEAGWNLGMRIHIPLPGLWWL